MRTPKSVARLLVAALVSTATVGCFVGEELDSSSALLGKGVKTAEKQEPGGAKPADGPKVAKADGGEAPPARPTGAAWWKTATTLGSEESTADIVACKVSGRLEFMQRDDCLSRGGAPE
jgi:hypothetical protein